MAMLPEQYSTDITGVPVVIEQKLVGYMVFKLSATIDRAKLLHDVADLRPYLSNAGFRASYEFAAEGRLRVRDKDLENLSLRVIALVDEALGERSVVVLNFEQFDFVRSATFATPL
jgi:hypothetical protein